MRVTAPTRPPEAGRGRDGHHMFGQFSGAAPLPAVPEGAVVEEDPSVAELEPESPVVLLEDEPEESLVCA